MEIEGRVAIVIRDCMLGRIKWHPDITRNGPGWGGQRRSKLDGLAVGCGVNMHKKQEAGQSRHRVAVVRE
jgi:hypothetical protein